MALSALLYIKHPNPFPPLHFSKSHIHPKKPLILTSTQTTPALKSHKKMLPHRPNSVSMQGVLSEAMNLIQSAPPTWQSAFFSNLSIFVVGSPILVSGLSLSGIFAAFLLGTLTWRAFGPSGFLLVASYFVIGTAATKVKMAQKEAQGVAEKRKGRRGPGSVIGSSAAGCVCAFLSIFGVGGEAFLALWRLGFVASFCTKLSDTISSEIGKAYGKTTYLVTTFKVVPRGTEGAVSVEGTLAGLLASILLASIGCFIGEINVPEAVICVIASQIANVGESIIGAVLQEKEGFQWGGGGLPDYIPTTPHPRSLRRLKLGTQWHANLWNAASSAEKYLPPVCNWPDIAELNNDAVNVINISVGSILAVLMQQIILRNWGA
ncbi:unnamed protein product [Dovyalis caffra]|uniref:Protein VTE6, chloroplastic n=1 Tax=Dovyalis caffra TaxID=77055 RepID=A0AAV1SLH0_9ROSI|nr:unnamed protein product [Dovyalis caffra]